MKHDRYAAGFTPFCCLLSKIFLHKLYIFAIRPGFRRPLSATCRALYSLGQIVYFLQMAFSELNRRPHASIDGNSMEISCSGKKWHLKRPASLDELWDAMSPDDFMDERIPYWAELWPASIALGEWLSQKRQEIEQNLCLDLGCGLGFSAIIASWLGAKVVAADLDWRAVAYCRNNATLNHVDMPMLACMDWRKPPFAKHCFQKIWGADIVYEKRFVQPLYDFINFALAQNGVAWLADPDRNIFPMFRERVQAAGWHVAPILKTAIEALYPQALPTGITIWEICRM